MTTRTLALGLAGVVALGAGAWLAAPWWNARAGVDTSATGETTHTARATPAAAAAAEPVRLRYAVKGMHCGGCAEAIVAEVKEVPGVAEVHCTFESGTAEILAADSALRAEIERAITKLGYTITPLPSAPVAPATNASAPAQPAGAPAGTLSSR